jgi:hypothetical protein
MSAPVWSKRLGTDSAAIFMNPGQNGEFPTVKLTHEYKDGDQFKPSTSFTLDEAMRFRQLLDLGIQEMVELQQQKSREQAPPQGHADRVQDSGRGGRGYRAA